MALLKVSLEERESETIGTPATRAPTPHRHCLRCAPRLPQFDVNRARLWFRQVGGTALHRQRLRQTLAHANRQQLHGRFALSKSSRQVEPTPAKYLVRVDAMHPRHTRHRHSGEGETHAV